MDAIQDLATGGLAVWQFVEVFNHSQLTLPLRRWANATVSAGGVKAFFAKIISCPFCFSHWVAMILGILLYLQHYVPWIQPVVWVLAATRLANLGNDAFYGLSRTPKADIEEDE